VEGRPTTIAELQPTSIPVDQNAARLFEKAALLLTNNTAPTAIQELSKLVQEFEYQNRNLDLRDFPANEPRWPLQNTPLVAGSKYPTLGDSWR